ncbi:cation diffusion facilitator family transporter [Ureibacillus terrenus]|uniref:Cation transporter n=2 Tax=Caryophanaceae TaxID=186818 RepID=A0A540V3I0_9BACL|nr:cation diffusion facilitator family transporter [Ureibacillus terrenus]MED3662869.1 cation diffusion facilitator family transporter [Ureibacillus terrenus]MED3763853.1 cation diffusion facilitator family transporter [Ureibacillus terrenus]TQE91297.1 cation transporter [Ureibacillus terrenus]
MDPNHFNYHGQLEDNKNKNALKWAFILITGFMMVEVAGGLITNSLALLSDAGHMLTDSLSLGFSLLALIIGQKEANSKKTYGYRRIEIFAALLNGMTLIGIALIIVVEAIHRITAPPEIASTGMLIVAVIGLLVNIAVAFILNRGKGDNLNVKSAFLHVLGDMLGSVGAITAALIILFFGWKLADPIASMIVAAVISTSGFRVVRESFNIFMEAAPRELSTLIIREKLLEIEEVVDVADLHLWLITSDYPSFTCHVVVAQDADEQAVLRKIQKMLHDEFSLHHMTIQIEKR